MGGKVIIMIRLAILCQYVNIEKMYSLRLNCDHLSYVRGRFTRFTRSTKLESISHNVVMSE